MKLILLISVVSCLAGTISAQEKGPFTISINRPAKAGDKYTLKSIAQIATTRSTAGGGSTASSNLERQATLLEGEMEIQAVTPKESQPWKYRVQITKCAAGEKEGAAELLPPGTQVTMELSQEKAPLLKVGGKVPAEPLLSLLTAALPPPATEDARPEDKMFGHAAKKSEDDEWKPDPAVVAAAFKKKGFAGETPAFKTRARLTEITDWDEIPSILVKGDVTIKPCTITVAGAKPASVEGSVSFASEYYLPLDPALPVVREKTETRVSSQSTAGSTTVSTEKVTWVSRMLKRK